MHPTTSCSFSSLLHRSTPREEAADSTPTSSSFSSTPREEAADAARQQMQSLAARCQPSHRGLCKEMEKTSNAHSAWSTDTVSVHLGGPCPVEPRIKRHKSLLRVSRSYENELREPKTVCWDSDRHVRVFSAMRLVQPLAPRRNPHSSTAPPPVYFELAGDCSCCLPVVLVVWL